MKLSLLITIFSVPLLMVQSCSTPRLSLYNTEVPSSYSNPESFLFHSVRKADIIAVMRLVEEGFVDINAVDAKGRTACICAVKYGDVGLVEYYISKKADLNIRDATGMTALMVALNPERSVILRLLLDAGADVNIPDKHGYTPLMKAAYYGNYDIVSCLVNYDADLTRVDKDGKTALDLARERGHRRVSGLLEVEIKGE